MSEDVFVIPASFAQERLWFLDQLQPERSNYNICAAFLLAGPLDLAALRRSLDELVRRHEPLRTTFGLIDGEPVQFIAASFTSAVQIVELQTLPPDERERRVRELSVAETQRRFDLEQGPLFRPTIVRLAPDEHVLLLTLHHIVADAWSAGILLRELSIIYEAYQRNEPSPLPEPSIQYADFAVWQRERLTGATLERELGYWKQQIERAPALLDLSGDARRRAGEFAGAREPVTLSEELSEAIRGLSREEGVTLFMMLWASCNAIPAQTTFSPEHQSPAAPVPRRRSRLASS